MYRGTELAVVVLLACTDGTLAEPAAAEAASELKKLGLEELMNMEVTTASKRAEKLAEVPAAIQVITGDDIRRSGASSIPEALRLAANLQVAQVDSSQWAISARGFNGTAANKLLVLIDGRSAYTPLFSGVFWDVQDTLQNGLCRHLAHSQRSSYIAIDLRLAWRPIQDWSCHRLSESDNQHRNSALRLARKSNAVSTGRSHGTFNVFRKGG